jgi:hypothetical protein
MEEPAPLAPQELQQILAQLEELGLLAQGALVTLVPLVLE